MRRWHLPHSPVNGNGLELMAWFFGPGLFFRALFWRGATWRGVCVELGLAWLCLAWCGSARLGVVRFRFNSAWRVECGLVVAWLPSKHGQTTKTLSNHKKHGQTTKNTVKRQKLRERREKRTANSARIHRKRIETSSGTMSLTSSTLL